MLNLSVDSDINEFFLSYINIYFAFIEIFCACLLRLITRYNIYFTNLSH